MKTAAQFLESINELKRQRDILGARYFLRESQIILMRLISSELDDIDKSLLSNEILEIISSPECLMTNDIEALALLYGAIMVAKGGIRCTKI